MASSCSDTPTQTKDQDISIPRTTFKPRNRRTPSFSSSSSRSNSCDSSSSFSFNEEDFSTNYSPKTPLKFKGIPFSWEENPGVPKSRSFKIIKREKNSDTDDHHHHRRLLLPLPPVKLLVSNNQELMNHPLKKYNNFRKDPFFAALVECSKDQDDDILKGSSKNGYNTRSLSERLGFVNVYASCKNACDVSDSSVYVPIKPRPHYLLNRH